jgi:hypothetical protein
MHMSIIRFLTWINLNMIQLQLFVMFSQHFPMISPFVAAEKTLCWPFQDIMWWTGLTEPPGESGMRFSGGLV